MVEKNILGGEMANISELSIYHNALELSNKIWSICLKWNSFAQNTVGYQIVKAADSISANLAEGYGRFHIKDNIHFCYYSRGSLEETKDWLRKSKARKLISENTYHELSDEIIIIAKQLNKYITSLKKKLHQLSQSRTMNQETSTKPEVFTCSPG